MPRSRQSSSTYSVSISPWPSDSAGMRDGPLVVKPTTRLCVLLRLAVLLNHGRSPEPLPAFRLTAGDDSLEVVFPDGWLDRHPLTRANLAQEAESLKAERLRLTFG